MVRSPFPGRAGGGLVETVAAQFVHLHNHTEYSLLDGAARIDDLFEHAARMGMPALAVTDHGVMYGAVDFYKAGKKHGVKPILGAELYVASRGRTQKESRDADFNHHLTVVAETQAGYLNLLKLVSAGWLEGYYYRPRVDMELLAQHHDGLIATSGCLGGEVCTHLMKDRTQQARDTAARYKDVFGPDNYFIELQDHGLVEQKKVNPILLQLAAELRLRTVATNDLHYTQRSDAGMHDALLCVQTGSTMQEAGRLKFDAEEFYLKSAQEMRAVFADVPEACDVTLEIAERCNVDLEFGSYKLPVFPTPNGEPVEDHLRRLVGEGATKRYGHPPSDVVQQRIEYELSTINDMGFASYFLIVADLIRFAKSNGVRCGPGRGSAAGSIVSYCLGITELDPIRYGLMFERFLNPSRREMPDIDMDFDVRGRNLVLKYATEKYGEDHVAQIVTFSTIKGKQAIRDAARVLDLPYMFGDRLAKMYPPSILGKDPPLAACFDSKHQWSPSDTPGNEAYQHAADLRRAYEEDSEAKRVIDLARSLEGLHRQAGVHAAGVVISDRPLVEYMPVKRAEDDAGGIVTQFEMTAVAELGLLKMDFLGLRNLSILMDTVENLRKRGIDLDIDALPLDDAQTFAMLSRGDTTGVFQMESNAMRDAVAKLKPDRLEDIIALVALYRPGPMDEIPKYIKGKHNPDLVQYLNPALEPILRDTHGVIVYQEQILQLLQLIAGYTAGEADLVRKAIGKKKVEIMRAEEPKFLGGAQAKGLDVEQAKKLWQLIQPFAGYSFNRAHAACYGYVAYQTAYLRAHYPTEYMSALLTSVRTSQDRMAFYLSECRGMGIKVQPPDVNLSDAEFTPSSDKEIRFGLSAVRHVGGNVVAAIIKCRGDVPFTSFSEFVHRMDPVALNKRVVESLAKAGAFDSLGVTRSDLLQVDRDKGVVLRDKVEDMLDAVATQKRNEAAGQFSLFGGGESEQLSEIPPSGEEIPQPLLLAAEKEMVGLYVSDHPLLAVEPALRACTDLRIADAHAAAATAATKTAGGIATRIVRRFTKKGEPMATFTLEGLDGAIEVVVFPATYAKAEQVLVNDAIVCVKGRVEVREDEAPKIVAMEVWRPNLEAGGDPLVLKIPTARAPMLVNQLKEVLQAHPGPTPVQVHLVAEDATVVRKMRIPDSLRVETRNGLYAELKSLLGSGVSIER